MALMLIFLLNNLYLKLCFLAHSTVKEWARQSLLQRFDLDWGRHQGCPATSCSGCLGGGLPMPPPILSQLGCVGRWWEAWVWWLEVCWDVICGLNQFFGCHFGGVFLARHILWYIKTHIKIAQKKHKKDPLLTSLVMQASSKSGLTASKLKSAAIFLAIKR